MEFDHRIIIIRLGGKSGGNCWGKEIGYWFGEKDG